MPRPDRFAPPEGGATSSKEAHRQRFLDCRCGSRISFSSPRYLYAAPLE
jgi:hypothetical protein